MFRKSNKYVALKILSRFVCNILSPALESEVILAQQKQHDQKIEGPQEAALTATYSDYLIAVSWPVL